MSGAWRWNSGGHRAGAGGENGVNAGVGVEDHVLTLLKRHQVQTLLAAGHDQIEVAVITMTPTVKQSRAAACGKDYSNTILKMLQAS